MVRKQLALDLESTSLQQNRFCLPLAFLPSYPSKLLRHFCNIRTGPGSYPVNVRTLKRMWQRLCLLIVIYHSTGVLIQVPLVTSVMFLPSLFSMRKCNVSVSTAKKGESIQAIGIGNCKITTLIANGELVNLILHDVLYVPDARRNLLSVSKLSQDRFQVVYQWIIRFSIQGFIIVENRSQQSNSQLQLFLWEPCFMYKPVQMQKPKRHDRVEKKWICWH